MSAIDEALDVPNVDVKILGTLHRKDPVEQDCWHAGDTVFDRCIVIVNDVLCQTLLVLDHVGDERSRIGTTLRCDLCKNVRVGDGAVLCEVRVHEASVIRRLDVGGELGDRLGRDLGRDAARRLRIAGSPLLEREARFCLLGALPASGVLDELVVLGWVATLVARAKQIRLPLDIDLIAEVCFELLDANRADVAPRSEKVGPDGDLDGIGRYSSHGFERRSWKPMASLG